MCEVPAAPFGITAMAVTRALAFLTRCDKVMRWSYRARSLVAALRHTLSKNTDTHLPRTALVQSTIPEWRSSGLISMALPATLPPRCSMELATTRFKETGVTTVTYDSLLDTFRQVAKPIDRYLLLRDLFRLDPKVYYSLLLNHTEEILPYIYTPTVGEACEKYHVLPLKTRGLHISLADRGAILAKLKTWPVQNVRVIVVTDGERILGLGDLGTNGMGISEGKITLYTAAAGVNPSQCLPICLDVGTNNASLLEAPEYQGIKAPRATGDAYYSFLAEFMGAVREWQPHCLVQFEDFGNSHAFHLLDTYRVQQCAFNDDIQGTACITLAGLLSAARLTGKTLNQHRILFLGAGEAGTGIGQLIAEHLHLRYGLSREEGRRHCFFMDSRGLVCASRTGLQHHKVPFAHDVPFCATLAEAVAALRPTAIIGVSTIAKAFDESVVRAMAQLNERPIIFPLSNPTSKAECTYEEAFRWTSGKVLFASGSPFNPITDAQGIVHYPAQANNAYIFPAVGMAALLTHARAISDEAFVVAAESLSLMTTLAEVEAGRLFPAFDHIRAISKVLAARVAEHMVQTGDGSRPEQCGQWEEYVAQNMWTA